MKVGIVHYGCGNIGSVGMALKRLNVNYDIVTSPSEMESCTHIILPGVGAFKHGMDCLTQYGLITPLKELEKPFLGICLGMQLLMHTGVEGGPCRGLGVIEGSQALLKTPQVPHMGWNSDISGRIFYFVHSYFCNVTSDEDVVTTTEHQRFEFPAIIRRNNFTGVQFHPERSGNAGLEFLKEWLDVA